jgi:tripartite-type tricarboxylate transporter receptor subunit TctC
MKRLVAAIALAAIGATAVHAQSFPNRPVTILVPLAPGGSTDTIGRLMAEGLRPYLG